MAKDKATPPTQPEIDQHCPDCEELWDDCRCGAVAQETICPKCGGTGLEWEGWDCHYCDGWGHLDF